MAYTVELSESASETLAQFDKPIAQRIVNRLIWLGENAEVIKHQALKGQWQGLFKLRVGNYRIIYRLEHENQVVIVEFIGHRRDIYKIDEGGA